MREPKKDVEVDLLVMATASLQEEIDKELEEEDPEYKGKENGNNQRDDGDN